MVIKADDLLGHPGRERPFHGWFDVSLKLVDSTINGPMTVSGLAVGTVDGIQVSFASSAEAHLRCVRCLVEWDEDIEVEGSQHFSRIGDEDGYAIADGEIDVGQPAMDELALGLPPAPVHEPGCKGLCPVCGNDLNVEPCDGHRDDSDFPFAVLKDLFDS